MQQTYPIVSDRTVEWVPANAAIAKNYSVIDNEFLNSGVHPSEFEGVPETEYREWAEQAQSGRVTQIKDGMIHIHLQKPLVQKFWNVAYPEHSVVADPALSEIGDVWGDWIEGLPTVEVNGTRDE